MIDDRLSRSAAMGRSETGSDVTSRQGDLGFLFVFLRHLPSIFNHFNIISDLSNVGNCRISVLGCCGGATDQK